MPDTPRGPTLRQDRVAVPDDGSETRGARNHKHYLTARLIMLNDISSFDTPRSASSTSSAAIKRPKEGLGLDNSPAQMWRTMLWDPAGRMILKTAFG